MTTGDIRDLIQKVTAGRFFKVVFRKRTTGEKRTMICRLGVRKYLRGGGAAYNPDDYNLMTVFDVHKKGYRSIPLDGLLSFQMGKAKWRAT